MSQFPKVRFAPSPTGYLHIGNIRAAIINFLYAKKTGGEFILRLDDTDSERVKDEYRDCILQDMEWLDLKYSKIIRQSDRLDKYEKAKNELIASGRLYECFETAQELSLQRKAQTSSGMKPIYDRKSLSLTKDQKQELRDSGIKPYYRFLLEDKVVAWDDKIKGRITYNGRHFSDPVLIRENGVPTYTFCSVVDDIELGITDIIRGEDHITNTAIQIQIFEALNGKSPNFAHLALIQAIDGKISKRVGGFDIKSLREEGFEPITILNFLAQTGTSKSIEIYKNLDKLVNNFDFANFSRSATKYDISDLRNINRKILQIYDLCDVAKRIKKLPDGDKITDEFYQIIKLNIELLPEISKWYKICHADLKFELQDQEFLKQIADLLPNDTKDQDAWQQWLSKIKGISSRSGKELFRPIRLALSGEEKGPEMKDLINLIPRDQIIKRLK